MSSDRRWVPIPVDDPDVTRINYATVAVESGKREITHSTVPVPPDDRLGDALQIVWEAAGREALRQQMAGEPEHGAVWEARERVFRAFDLHSDDSAFQLGEEE